MDMHTFIAQHLVAGNLVTLDLVTSNSFYVAPRTARDHDQISFGCHESWLLGRAVLQSPMPCSSHTSRGATYSDLRSREQEIRNSP